MLPINLSTPYQGEGIRPIVYLAETSGGGWGARIPQIFLVMSQVTNSLVLPASTLGRI